MKDTYQADKVDPKETEAINIFQLAYMNMNAGLSKIPLHEVAFNFVVFS